MKVLITGATGFLGEKLALHLHDEGLEVLATGRNLAKAQGLITKGIRFKQADLTDQTSVQNLVKNQHQIIHCAALSSPWGKYEAFYQANVVATENLLQAALAEGLERFIHLSTPALYFSQSSRLNVREDAEQVAPQNAYIATKRLAEQRVDDAYAQGLATISLRPRAIYGPGDSSILPRLLKRLEQGRLPILGDGQNLVDLSYVDNVVDAVLLAVDAPEHCLGKKYNITNGEAVRLWDKIFTLCDLLHLKRPRRKVPKQLALVMARAMEIVYGSLPRQPEPPLTRYTVGLLVHSMTLDISAAQKELSYEPRVSTDEGLERFLASWPYEAWSYET
ncbi:MAG: NAD(P)-dependent oxidoreductase [Trueperaceae bacterium]|nr:NAD(P)-dependent oxidoreductase [Trueperaceae bacterium]